VTPSGDWIGLSVRYPDRDLIRDASTDAAPRSRYRAEEMPLAYEMACATGRPTLLPDVMVGPQDGLVEADLPGNPPPGELWIADREARKADRRLRAVVDCVCPAGSEGASASPVRSARPFHRQGRRRMSAP
jgi:DNA-binding transcriptional LysR family regulator